MALPGLRLRPRLRQGYGGPEGYRGRVGGQVVALRPVEILSRDYAELEYGITATQMKTIAKKLHAKAQKARRTGKAKVFNGDIETLLKD